VDLSKALRLANSSDSQAAARIGMGHPRNVEYRYLTAAPAFAIIITSMSGAEKQFSPARALSMNREGLKIRFAIIRIFSLNCRSARKLFCPRIKALPASEG
jgi:hypothetical protein